MNPTTQNRAQTKPIACPMCGYTYDPAGNTACQACPLNKGCQLVCCPNCGYETADPNRSSLARLVTRFFSSGQKS